VARDCFFFSTRLRSARRKRVHHVFIVPVGRVVRRDVLYSELISSALDRSARSLPNARRRRELRRALLLLQLHDAVRHHPAQRDEDPEQVSKTRGGGEHREPEAQHLGWSWKASEAELKGVEVCRD